jgi:Etoposide-induced protein 2.4 (EI24)
VLFLPFNLIPIVGTPLFLVLTGRRAGPFQHWRYFKLLGFGRKERNAAIKQRRWSYTWFGTVALVLQLLPVLSMGFLLTTATGAALWAADLEKRRISIEEAEDEPAEYVDERTAV